jgi:hypothetical protein
MKENKSAMINNESAMKEKKKIKALCRKYNASA